MRFRPCPPALQADQEQLAVLVVLKSLYRRLPVARVAIQILIRHLGCVQPLANNRQQARELREDQRLVPLLADLVQLLQQHVQLGAGLGPSPRVQQPGMARRLAQPEQGLQHVHFRSAKPVLLDAVQQGLPIMPAQIVVLLALRPFQLAEDRLFGLRRQLPRHLLLRSPQDERTKRIAQQAARLLAGIAGQPPAIFSTLASPSIPGLRNSKRLHSSPM